MVQLHIQNLRKSARVVESARLESVYGGNVIGGSNPPSSARQGDEKLALSEAEGNPPLPPIRQTAAFTAQTFFCTLNASDSGKDPIYGAMRRAEVRQIPQDLR